MTPLPLSIFSVSLLGKFPQRVQARSLLQTQSPLQSRRYNRRSLPPQRLKILDVPIRLSCYISVRTHHKCTLQPKLGISIYLRDQYLSTTSNVNLSPTQSPSIKILFKCDISIGSQTRVNAVGDRGFTNTLED